MPNENVIEVRDAPNRGVYVVTADGVEAGRAEYRMRDGRHVFVHTEVDDSYTGMGIGSKLVRGALEDLRAEGGRVVALCPFVAAYLKRHPEFDDLVDHELTQQYRRRRNA